MSALSTTTDWENADLRGAAVDYARHEMRGGGVSVGKVAEVLGVCAAKLGAWIREAAGEAGRPGVVEPGEEEELMGPAGGSGRKARLEYFPDWDRSGAWAGVAVSDPLRDLLREEDRVLEVADRSRLADALEAGVVLSQGQRLALAVALRGSDLAGRRELVRAVIDFVVPPDKQVETIWERVETEVVLPPGAVWTEESMEMPLPVGGRLGGLRLVARSEGRVLWVRFFAYVRRSRWTGAGKDAGGRERLAVVYLRPVARFAKDHVLHQFALLASMVREDGRTGKEWGELFGRKSGKAIASYHRKKLAVKLKGEDGHAGVRGVR